MFINTLLVASLAITSAQSVELWAHSLMGESLSKVQAALPDSRHNKLLTVLTGGEVSELEKDGPLLDGRPSRVDFYFKDGLLNSLQVSLPSLSASASEQNMEMATRIAKSLTTTYSHPFDCGDRSAADIAVYECKWLTGKLLVRLWYMDVTGQAPRFAVTYWQVGNQGYDF